MKNENSRFWAAVSTALCLLLSFQRGAVGQDLRAAENLQTAVKRAIAASERSVVAIARVRGGEVDRVRSPDFIPRAFGTGVLFAPRAAPRRRLILTNYHLVRGGPVAERDDFGGTDRLIATFPGGRTVELEIIAADPHSDLAVLAFDDARLGVPAHKLPAIRFGRGIALSKGDFIVVLGNPYAIARDGSPSSSFGSIANVGRRPAPLEETVMDGFAPLERIHHHGTLLHLDTRLAIGASGGAVVNLRGELVGITTSLAAIQGYDRAAGFAVPLDDAIQEIVQTLAQGLEFEYGFLGIRPSDVSVRQLSTNVPIVDPLQASVARIQTVIVGAPAARGRPEPLLDGDVIVKIAGRDVTDVTDVMRKVALIGAGKTVNLRIWRPRGDQTLDVTVNLGKWPVRDDEGIVATRYRYPLWRGLRVDYSTGRQRYFSNSRCYDAVLVREVAKESPADEANLAPGDLVKAVGDVSVTTPKEFHDAVAKARGDVTLVLLNGRRLTVRLERIP